MRVIRRCFAARLSRTPCADKIERAGLVIVRGYVEGSEQVAVGKALSTEAKVTMDQSGEFKVRYEGNGSFEMIHEPVLPRFFIMSSVHAIRLGGVSPGGPAMLWTSRRSDDVRDNLLRAERVKCRDVFAPSADCGVFILLSIRSIRGHFFKSDCSRSCYGRHV